MLITLDKYYNTKTYNDCKESLKNNGIEINEYMSTKPPYQWYLDLPYAPLLMNYDKFNSSNRRFLVSIVKPLTANDCIEYYRRPHNKNKLDYKFILNDCFNDLKDSDFVVFNAQSITQLKRLSSRLKTVKVWYLGKYVNKIYRVAIVESSDLVYNMLPYETILYKRDKKEKIETFECNFNQYVLTYRDRLQKFASTPYFLNGEYVVPRILPKPQSRFLRI